ncbi:TIR domain-containing protein [Peribacillus frigoritolerans]|uniref:TIR domain-containing protein n=1 Tax=Peribacillus frigoritolerans TaxID=450367 RepID=UPI0022278DED|nr:TIR domain-containing protein [Peribacillus frigoritolerans]UYY99650.1 TIR domain-containing protein [Peribacillus frigoritolerans]
MINKIFISHSSKDEIFCTAFVDFLEGIGIPEDMILYTSSPRHGIPGDENIFKYLRNHIAEGITVFYMLSDNYYQSPYCLNEMGAAWITQNDFSTFLLPNFTEGIKGVIDSDIKAYTLSVPYDLISLKAKLTKQFNLKVSDGKFEDLKSKLLNSVSVKEIGS